MIWPPAEAEMALVLGLLLGAENAAAMAVFQSLRRSSSQREAIAEAGKIRLPPSDQDLLNAVLNVHKSIEAERNALAYGHFGMYSELKDSLPVVPSRPLQWADGRAHRLSNQAAQTMFAK
jgi:hypothetical protein